MFISAPFDLPNATFCDVTRHHPSRTTKTSLTSELDTCEVYVTLPVTAMLLKI